MNYFHKIPVVNICKFLKVDQTDFIQCENVTSCLTTLAYGHPKNHSKSLSAGISIEDSTQ